MKLTFGFFVIIFLYIVPLAAALYKPLFLLIIISLFLSLATLSFFFPSREGQLAGVHGFVFVRI